MVLLLGREILHDNDIVVCRIHNQTSLKGEQEKYDDKRHTVLVRLLYTVQLPSCVVVMNILTK